MPLSWIVMTYFQQIRRVVVFLAAVAFLAGTVLCNCALASPTCCSSMKQRCHSTPASSHSPKGKHGNCAHCDQRPALENTSVKIPASSAEFLSVVPIFAVIGLDSFLLHQTNSGSYLLCAAKPRPPRQSAILLAKHSLLI